MTTADLIRRVDRLMEMGNAVLRTRRNVNRSQQLVDSGLMAGFRSASLSLIERVYDRDHSHYAEFSDKTNSRFPSNVEGGLEILKVIREEIAGGWLFTIKGMVTAEVFRDYMEMAEYLLLELKLKDPAAVIAGSTLEEHLRQLCKENGISVVRQKDGKNVPLKADQMNNDLTKAEVYTMLDQKNVTAWLDLRNKAAHGEYQQYNPDQVKGMIAGITEFMARVAV